MRSRTVHTTRTGDASFKWRLRIEDDLSSPDTEESFRLQMALLRSLVEQPELLMCGPIPAQKLRLFHSGKSWVIEAEAEVFAPQS